MPKFYRRVMSQTLLARVEEALEAPAAEQMALNEELALMRETACDAVKFYSDAEAMHRAAEAAGNQELIYKTQAQLQEAGQFLQQHLERVGDYVIRMARIESLSKDTLTVHTVYAVIAQVVRVFYSVCGEEYEHLAREVERRVRDEVKVPGSNSAQGTDITPDADVLAMDATVPRAPDRGGRPPQRRTEEALAIQQAINRNG